MNVPLTRSLLITQLLLVCNMATGQYVISLEEAFRLTLERNESVQISDNFRTISENNLMISKAAFLPNIGLNAALSSTLTRTDIEFSSNDIPNISASGVSSRSYFGNVLVSQTIFNGFRNNLNYRLYNSQVTIADLEFRLTIQNLFLQVAERYFSLAKAIHETEIKKNAISISIERLNRSRNKYQFGKIDTIDMLAAEIALNADSTSYVRSLIEADKYKRQLAILIGLDGQLQEFSIDTRVDLIDSLPIPELNDEIESNNLSLQIARLESAASEIKVGVSRSNFFPTLNLTGEYGLNRNENDAAFLRLTQNIGFTGGLSVSLNLFNGGVRAKHYQNAKIAFGQQELKYQSLKRATLSEISQLFYENEMNKTLLKLEQRNLDVVKKTFNRASERYDQGLISSLEFREAQLDVLRSNLTINELVYTVKVDELRLVHHAGMLFSPGLN